MRSQVNIFARPGMHRKYLRARSAAINQARQPHPSLFARVKHLTGNYPGMTASQMFEYLRRDFPQENPRWLRQQISIYRSKHRAAS